MTLNPDHPFRSAAAREEYLALYDRRAARWPVPSETRTAETSYGQTFVRISGPAGAPPLVLLPGMTSSGLMWETLIEPLSERYRTYAVDNVYDVGRSVWSREMRGAADYTRWLDELLTALALGDDVNLMGMSYGAWITAHMALAHPERLRRSVWLAPPGIVARVRWRWVLRALLAGLHPWLHRNFTYWMFADAVKTAAGRRMAHELIDDTAVAMRCFTRRRVVMPAVMSDEQLGRIRVPSLYLVGEHETIYSARRALARLNAVAPQIQGEILPDAGHDLPIVQAELLTQRVLAFLDG